MTDWPILSTVTFLPLVGVFFILLIRGDEQQVATNSRHLALWTSTVTFALSLVLIADFDTSTAEFQFVELMPWLPEHNIGYHLGVDGISIFFLMLTTFLVPICILASWEAIGTRVREFMIAFLVMETLIVGVFCSLDFVMFYIFFEGQLIPMFLIIGIWGGARRVYSAFKFFLYTLVGSVLFLLAILFMYSRCRHHRHPDAAGPRVRAGGADLALARALRLLRGQAADVALPYLAARRPCGGADRGLGDPRRHPAEDGRLRLPPLLAADAARRERLLRALRLFAERGRDYLHVACGADAAGHEEADRLFLGRPYGDRHHRHLHLHRPGHRGRHNPDAEPRHRLGRALPLRRRGLRPHPHPRHRGLWRAGAPDAHLRRGASWCSPWPPSACPALPASSASSWCWSAPSSPTPGSPCWR